MLRSAFPAFAICTCATAALAQPFTLDVPLGEGMARLGMQTLLDAPVGQPVHISSFQNCVSDGTLYVIGLSRQEAPADAYIGLIEVTRRTDGAVDLVIPDPADPYADMEFYEEVIADSEFLEEDAAYLSDRDLTLLTLLQPLPCSDWGEISEDPATLLPVATIDGETSMSGLLDALTEAAD